MKWLPQVIVFIVVPIIFIVSIITLSYSLYNAVIDYVTEKLDKELEELKKR
jgi:hypothetical protein